MIGNHPQMATALIWQASADALAADVKRVLDPLLQRNAKQRRLAQLEPFRDVEDELATWEKLLYKPVWSPLATNVCFDPALASTIDQCGQM